MIAPPMNDHACLVPTTAQIVAEIEAGNPAIVDLASRFSDTDELAAWFRSLPQRDDDGVPGDGPKVHACRPPQRLRFDATDPNCFERSARFIGAAELIDPDRVYRLATVATPNGLHTFPTRDGEPVILDPQLSRNAPRISSTNVSDDIRRVRLQRLIGLDETRGVRGDLARARRARELGQPTWIDGAPIDEAIATYEKTLAHYQAQLDAITPRDARRARNAHPSLAAPAGPIVLTPAQAVDWIADLAKVRAQSLPGALDRIERGHRAMRGVLALRPICLADVREVALVLALAEREARHYGLAGLKIVHSTARALDALDRMAADRVTTAPRNNPLATIALSALTHPKTLEPLLGALGRVGGRIAGGIGVEALKQKLARVGVSPPVIAAFEKELNREGLSLGRLAKPSPLIGSLDAMTPQALAGRWLAQKL